MTDNYDDIEHLTRPQYDYLHPMSMHDRAAQFSPFAAPVGYGDAVAETARLTDSRAELTEDEMTELNADLNRLLDSLDERPQISDVFSYAIDMDMLTYNPCEKMKIPHIGEEKERQAVCQVERRTHEYRLLTTYT